MSLSLCAGAQLDANTQSNTATLGGVSETNSNDSDVRIVDT